MRVLVVACLSDEDAARRLHSRLRTRHPTEIHSPIPIEGVEPPPDTGARRLPRIAATAAVLAATVSLAAQYYTGELAYPVNIGGRPVNWVPYVFAAVALAMMCSALAAAIAFLRLSGLPDLRARVFAAERDCQRGRDWFLVSVEVGSDDCENVQREVAAFGGVRRVEVVP